MSISNLTPQEFRLAADLQEKIAGLNIQLALLLDPGSAIPAPIKAVKLATRGMSAAGRAHVGAANKLRGAKRKAAKVKRADETKPKLAKRTISASHIAKIKAGQKIRWAKYNAAKAKTSTVKPVTAKPAKKKRGMSAEGRARIVAAQKARWAKIKAAKK